MGELGVPLSCTATENIFPRQISNVKLDGAGRARYHAFMRRLPIPQYVMALAHVAALRSEDPYRKVGAAALDKDNRVIGTAYNGLFPGFTAPEGFWASRQERQKFMMHAEINLCSLFKRGEAKVVACTTMPCTSCMQALCAHGVKTIYYGEAYKESQAPAIAELYGVELIQVKDYPLSQRFPLVQ